MTFTVTLSKRAFSFGWLQFLGIKRTPPPPAHPWWKDSTQRWKGCWWLMVPNKFHRRFGNPNSTRWYPCNKHLQPSTLIGSLRCKVYLKIIWRGLIRFQGLPAPAACVTATTQVPKIYSGLAQDTANLHTFNRIFKRRPLAANALRMHGIQQECTCLQRHKKISGATQWPTA